jgi:hypothetical protein
MIVSATAPSPCKDCEDRCIGCHTTCGDYAIYRQTLEQNRARINAQNDENAFMSEIKREVYKRHNKRRKGDDR